MELKTKGMILSALFASLTAIGGLIAIPLPFTPVPITLQVLFTLLSGALLGRFLGALSQLLYLLLGIIGLPVFAKGTSGLGCLVGPTGGYLWGFILGSFVVGSLLEKKDLPSVEWTYLAMALGLLAVYVPGVCWLMVLTRLSLGKALILGALPFIPGDLLKIFLAGIIVNKLRKRKVFQSL